MSQAQKTSKLYVKGTLYSPELKKRAKKATMVIVSGIAAVRQIGNQHEAGQMPTWSKA
jgi:hypothetical protein